MKNVQSIEELRDVYQHFLLYYGTDIPKMKNFMKAKAKKMKSETGVEGEEEEKKEEDEDEEADTLKQASRKTGYSICVQAGLGEFFAERKQLSTWTKNKIRVESKIRLNIGFEMLSKTVNSFSEQVNE